MDWWKEQEKHDTSPHVEQAKDITKKSRYEICKECNDLSVLLTCKHCNCFMPIKTKLKWEKCPIGKWGYD
jgi:hypothetical protein